MLTIVRWLFLTSIKLGKACIWPKKNEPDIYLFLCVDVWCLENIQQVERVAERLL